MVSVLMTTYNGEKYIAETIRSVLAQTYADFEFIIVDDCSTDSTADIVSSFKDSRIKLICNPRNLGISGASNAGLDACRGKYIVRHDHDDISLPDRFAKQVAFMDANPDIGASGTWYAEFGGRNRVKRNVSNPDELAVKLLRGCYIQHPTSIISKDVLDKYSIRYRENLKVANDYCLWLDILGRAKVANIPEILFKYRIHKTQTGMRYANTVADEYFFARKSFFARYASPLSDSEIKIFSDGLIDGSLCRGAKSDTVYGEIADVAQKLVLFNRRNKIFCESALRKFLQKMYAKRCMQNALKFGGYFHLKNILKRKLLEVGL